MAATLTRRQEIVLAALSTDIAARFAPVQVQKLFFLIDENLARHLGKKQFQFAPYNYGPFDAEVYRELENLSLKGLVNITSALEGQRRYSVTPAGYARGHAAQKRLKPEVAKYMADTSRWVQSLSFAELVGAIYRAYPAMRQNSIFAG